MQLTRRLLKGMIAGNPGNFAGLGEWRYCHTCGQAFFTRASQPDTVHATHRWSALPALDPEGHNRLAELFQRLLPRAFSPQRQAELRAFAQRQGWEMAYELQDGGGALTAAEVVPWRAAVEAELERLVDQAEQLIAAGSAG